MGKVLRCVALLLVCSWLGLAQSFRPEQLMVLVIGASAARPDPDETAVVQRLQQLRQQSNLRQLKMASMHFDRPKEAQFAQTVLGVRKTDLPCLVLVQLDKAQKVPVRSLYSMPRVTRQSLQQVDQLAAQWSATAGLAPSSGMPPLSTRTPGTQPGAGEPSRLNNDGSAMAMGQSLRVPNYSLQLQPDGNLVLCRASARGFTPIWSTDTAQSGASVLKLGPDGILRLTSSDGRTVWHSPNQGVYGTYYLLLQPDGNLVIYRVERQGVVGVWHTNTNER
jgi:hypothetical protein